MRTTITLDDQLIADARVYTGIKENSALVNGGERLSLRHDT